MNDSTEQRIVKNNLTFRNANEQIRAKAEEYDARLEKLPFLCECPRPDCVQIVRLSISEYATVRTNPNHYFTAPGHEAAEDPVGRVVAREDRFVVIEKDKTAVEG
jgi:hypothetical protein